MPSQPGTPDLRFQVLGPLRADHLDGYSLALGSPQQQAVLTVLLLRGTRSTTAQQLVEALWEQPPPLAIGALRTYVSRLRSALEPDRPARTPAKLLISVGDGYALQIPPTALDATRFEQRLTAAANARNTGDFTAAHDHLSAALALWQGEALAGVPGPFAARERDRLGELRVTATEDLFDAALHLGRHADSVAELSALCAEHPLRERFRALLMLALHRSGRQVEALAVHADLRRTLHDELGIEPGPELARLQAQVLAGDPGLTWQPAVVPAQLPPDVADFTGHADLLTSLIADLRSGRASLLTGLGGVGKTTLAVHAAHAVRADFPDGQLYVDLRGADPAPVSSSAALTQFLRALGVTEHAVPDELGQQSALLRSLLADRRVLILLDNAHDSAQLRPLLPAAPGTAVLVTSRSRTITLPGARLVDVEVLTEPDALDLLAAIAGHDRVHADPAAAGELVEACGRLPLALRIAASRLAARPSWAVADLTARLRDQQHRLDELRVGDLAVESAFQLGYAALSPAAARAFRLLALSDAPSFRSSTAAVVLEIPHREAEAQVESLVDSGLMEVRGAGHYRYHDLVKLFARRQSERTDSDQDRAAALRRLLDHALATVITAVRRLKPSSALPQHLHQSPAAGTPLPDAAAARTWLHDNHTLLVSTVDQALPSRPAVDLLTGWAQLVLGTARHRDLEPLARRALEHRGDDTSAARALRVLAAPHYGSDTYGRSERDLRESLKLAESAQDELTLAMAAHELGIVLMAMGQPKPALPLLRQAYDRFTAMNATSDAIQCLSHTARAHIALGHPDEAVALVTAATDQAREFGPTGTLGPVLYQAGCTLLQADRPGPAADRFRESLACFTELEDLRWVALVWARLAHCELAQQQDRAAIASADRALAIERDLGDAYCRGLAQSARGQALLRLGEPALDSLQEAYSVLNRRGAAEAAQVRTLLDSAS